MTFAQTARCLLRLVASSCLAACGSSKPAACDQAAIDQGLGNLAMISGSKSAFAAALVAESCKLPQALKQGLVEIARSGECLSAADGIAGAPDLVRAACAGGHESLAQIREAAEPNVAIVDVCQLERLGFATRAELVAGGHWACKLLGAMTFVALQDAGDPAAMKVARALAVQ